MSPHHNDWTVRGPGVDVREPWLEFVNLVCAHTDVIDHLSKDIIEGCVTLKGAREVKK